MSEQPDAGRLGVIGDYENAVKVVLTEVLISKSKLADGPRRLGEKTNYLHTRHLRAVRGFGSFGEKEYGCGSPLHE
jgi:hypothetical protein